MAKIDFTNASAEDITIIDDDQISYLYGGRYTSDEYIKVPDDEGKQVNMHRVTVELLCDDEQFISLIKTSKAKGNITVKLV